MATNNCINTTYPISVNTGGTGATTLTAHGVLLGEGTSPLVATAAGSTGQVLIGSTGADPSFGSLGVNSGLTAHSLLLGQGTSAITALGVATNGQIPIGSTGSDPVLATLSSAGSTIAITNGAGTINLDTASSVATSFITGSGTATPSSGVLTVPNGTNIHTTGSGSTLTVSLFTSPSVSGTVTAAGGFTASGGNVLISSGNLNLPNTNSAFTHGVVTFGGAQWINNYGTGNIFLGGSGNGTLNTGLAIANTAIGGNALTLLTTGAGNIALGNSSCNQLSSGNDNMAVGSDSVAAVTSGSYNVGVGTFSLNGVTTGSYNIAVGQGAGSAYTTSDSSNIVLNSTGVSGESNAIRLGTQGSGSQQQNTCYIAGISGASVANSVPVYLNTVTGQLGTTSSGGTVAITTLAATSGTATGSTVTIAGGSNISTSATGSTLTVNLVNSPSVSGTVTAGNGFTATMGNVTITAGNLTLPNTTSGFATGAVVLGTTNFLSNFGLNNTFVGGAGNATLSTAADNVGIGGSALASLTTGNYNMAFGFDSMLNVNSGSQNAGIGYGSFQTLTSGNGNVGIGWNAINSLATGSFNTAIGYIAGSGYTGAESSNILFANNGVAGESNTIRIGTQGGGSAQQNTCYIAGITGVTVSSSAAVLINTSTGQLGTVSSSQRFKDRITDMGERSSRIMDLRPVNFAYKTDEHHAIQWGLIAEEVAQVMPELVTFDILGVPYTVRYHDMPAILLNELQKLSKRVKDLEAKLAS